jgi:hypothetical protein
MMYVFGEVAEPLEETAQLIEEIAQTTMMEVVKCPKNNHDSYFKRPNSSKNVVPKALPAMT